VKRTGGLFARIHAFPNLLAAARRAATGKRFRPDVLAFEHALEAQLVSLSEALRAGVWRPAGHRHFRILEPKPRWISAAPFADRVVHHAICNVIQPVMERGLIHDCWANRKGFGSHRAVLRYQRFAQRYRFALKVDLQKYFPSVDHGILKAQFRRVFREAPLLELLDRIVDQSEGLEPVHHLFPGDDLLTAAERPRGLPIGNLTSQLWANTYLSPFDHWVKEDLKGPAYLRYVDDFVLLADDKAWLHDARDRLTERLAELRQVPHPRKTVIRRTDEGVPFLGYVVWPERIRIRGESLRRYRRRLRGLPRESVLQSLAAWRGHAALVGRHRCVVVR
jgi:RNA-directed DNA polymerase